jgi:hypothetical protein
VKKLAIVVAVGAALIGVAFADDTDLALDRFRSAYIAGKGLTYVLITNDKGERVYRYGDVSREAARRNNTSYMLFTCIALHVFDLDRISHRALLKTAKVVHAGEPGFEELDARYLAGCHNPFVKSAVPPHTKTAAPQENPQ